MKRKAEKNILSFAAVRIAVIFLVAAGAVYYVYVNYVGQSAELDGQSFTVAQTEAEIVRIATLASEKSLSTEDLVTLRSMVEGNEAVEHEFEELETLVKYGEYEHAAHTIAFLDSTLKSGKHSLCPEHLVAHYYVFSKHGEADLAMDSLEDAKSQIHEWEGPAREFNERYPSGRSFDEIMENLERHIAAIESGDASATDEEVLELANRAICIEGGFDHAETSYNDRHIGEPVGNETHAEAE